MKTEENKISESMTGGKETGDLKSRTKDRGRLMKASPIERRKSLGSTVKLPDEIYRKLVQLLENANGSGPKRVQPKDMIEVALSKVTADDLVKLRISKATVRDQFQERLREFQAGDASKTEEMFLSYLLSDHHRASTTNT